MTTINTRANREELNIGPETEKLFHLVNTTFECSEDLSNMADALEAALLALVDIAGLEDGRRISVAPPAKVARRAITRITHMLEEA